MSLNGTLGTGKTCMAKGLVSELAGVPENAVTSPAYSLVNEYERGDGEKVYHLDFYRLEDSMGLDDSEIYDEIFGEMRAIVIVEWGHRFLENFTNDYISVTLDFLDEIGDDARTITLEASLPSSTSTELLAKFEAAERRSDR